MRAHAERVALWAYQDRGWSLETAALVGADDTLTIYHATLPDPKAAHAELVVLLRGLLSKRFNLGVL